MTREAAATEGAPCKTSPCRSCAAPIFLARTEKDKLMPVNALPDAERGNLRVWRDQQAGRMRTEVVPEAERAGADLFVSHFVTCPQSARWRKS
jgi:hypothetical protein